MMYDYVVIGAGIAGASVAAEIGGAGRVLLVEAESAPGYHATGRSAAFWSETYGGPEIQPLTTASFDMLSAPAENFYDRSFLNTRGALHIADADGEGALADVLEQFAGSDVDLIALSEGDIEHYVSGISPAWPKAVLEPTCSDIDVAALHGAYLTAAKSAGVELRCAAGVSAIEKAGDGWRLNVGHETVEAQVIVNAAGAWADEIAQMAGIRPLGISAYRRTMVQLRINPPAPEDMPLVIDALGRFYFKAEAGGRLWLSPHDEIPQDAGDVAAEEIDVAVAIDWLEKATDWKVEAVERKWAGLRSFSPDRLPVYGFDPLADGFFWCAGQGGFGIQTVPAAAKLCRATLTGEAPDAAIHNVNAALYAPDRFRQKDFG